MVCGSSVRAGSLRCSNRRAHRPARTPRWLAMVERVAEIPDNYPSKDGVGERAAWFKDSEGNLLPSVSRSRRAEVAAPYSSANRSRIREWAIRFTPLPLAGRGPSARDVSTSSSHEPPPSTTGSWKNRERFPPFRSSSNVSP